MADSLKRAIYHEKQEGDSNLCAQHALNSLLQQSIFTAMDLASIAQSLDTMEQSYDDGNRGKSTNMDDSGFFSIQVLENALQVWGLTLVSWRSEAMRQYQDHPYTQLAFILNLEQHWFTLRRFGPANPNLVADTGEGHWFNLNSFLASPEWVSKTYLGMVLQQAETEGYSVFAVTQIDPNGSLGLARTMADELATRIPEITNASTRISTARSAVPGQSTAQSNQGWSAQTGGGKGLEDEDMELQAALLASVMGESAESTSAMFAPPKLPPIQGVSAEDDWDMAPTRSAFGGSAQATTSSGQDELAKFQEERMKALSKAKPDDKTSKEASTSQTSAHATETSPPQRRAPRPRREDEEEEEMIRRAIEASKKQKKDQEELDDEEEDHDVSFEDDDLHPDDEEEEKAELERLLQERRKRQAEQEEHNRIRQGARSTTPTSRLARDVFTEDFDDEGADYDHGFLQDRTYDDEDAMLQAALKASLEGSADISIPSPPKPPTRAPTSGQSTGAREGSGAVQPRDPASTSKATNESDEEEEGEEEEVVPEPPKPLTAAELRAARLARFGGK